MGRTFNLSKPTNLRQRLEGGWKNRWWWGWGGGGWGGGSSAQSPKTFQLWLHVKLLARSACIEFFISIFGHFSPRAVWRRTVEPKLSRHERATLPYTSQRSTDTGGSFGRWYCSPPFCTRPKEIFVAGTWLRVC